MNKRIKKLRKIIIRIAVILISFYVGMCLAGATASIFEDGSYSIRGCLPFLLCSRARWIKPGLEM